jgi:hypothetical protein
LDVVTGTIFDGVYLNADGTPFVDEVVPQIWEAGIQTTDAVDEIQANGLLATVTFDASGFGAYQGPDQVWDLKLLGVAGGIADTMLLGHVDGEPGEETVEVPSDIIDGTVVTGAFGDVDLNGQVDIFDILDIKLGPHGFDKPGPAGWVDGDCADAAPNHMAPYDAPNGVVDIFDIITIKLAGHFNAGPYATVAGEALGADVPAAGFAATQAAGVPEPGTLILLLTGALGLLWVLRRR